MVEPKAARAGVVNFVPVPDPTTLTNEAVERAAKQLRELIEARLNGSDQRIGRIETAMDRLPEERRVAIDALGALHDERFQTIEKQTEIKFLSVQTQFVERDRRTEQLSVADKTAIAAALQAQKEAAAATNESNSVAIGKMETNFSKLIDQGRDLLAQTVRSTDEKINDLKSRLDRGEGKVSVSDPAVADGIRQLNVITAELMKSRASAPIVVPPPPRDITGWIFGAVGIGLSVFVVIFVVLRTGGMQ